MALLPTLGGTTSSLGVGLGNDQLLPSALGTASLTATPSSTIGTGEVTLAPSLVGGGTATPPSGFTVGPVMLAPIPPPVTTPVTPVLTTPIIPPLTTSIVPALTTPIVPTLTTPTVTTGALPTPAPLVPATVGTLPTVGAVPPVTVIPVGGAATAALGPPVAHADTVSEPANTTSIIPASLLLANDQAPVAGDTLHLVAVSQAQHAIVQLTPQDDVSFTPDAGFVGQASFVYTLADQFGSQAAATVTVTVQPPQFFIPLPAVLAVQASDPGQAQVFFDGTSQAHGNELWSSDGHTVGEVADINPGQPSSTPADLAAIGGLLYFSANDGIHGREPWTFDGQHAQMLADINPSGSSDPQDFTQLGNTVFFSASDGIDGRQLWQAGSGGVQMVTDINPGAVGADPANLTPLGGTLYFTASDGQHGDQLWRIAPGGTPAQITALNPGAAGAQPDSLTGLGNTLYFVANDGSFGRQLFSVNGSGALLEQVINLGPGGAFAPAGTGHALVAVGSDLYFVADGPGQAATLWHEHAGGTAQAVGTVGPAGAPVIAVDGVAAGHDVYFAVSDSQGNSELARFDTATGTLTPNIAPDLSSAPAEFTAVNNTLFFTVLNHTSQGGVQFRDLYVDDGQTSHKVDLGSQQTLPHDLTASQGQLYFADHGLLETATAQASPTVATLTAADGHLYNPVDIAAAPHEVPLLV